MRKLLVLMILSVVAGAPQAALAVPDNTTIVPESNNDAGAKIVSTVAAPESILSADIHKDGKRDYRLACAQYSDNPSVENCRKYYKENLPK